MAIVTMFTHNNSKFRYLDQYDHWECNGMKVVLDITLYKGEVLVYHWGRLPNQDLNDVKKFPYKESGFRGTLVGVYPCEYDRIVTLTSNDKGA